MLKVRKIARPKNRPNFLVLALQKLPWPIRRKLTLAFVLVLACFVFNGLTSTALLFSIQATEEQQQRITIYKQQAQSLQASYNAQLEQYSDAVFVIKSNRFSDKYRADIFGKLILPSNNGNEAAQINRAFIVATGKQYQKVIEHFDELERYLQQSNFEQAAVKWREFKSDFDQVAQTLQKRLQYLEGESVNAKNAVNNAIVLSVSIIVGVSLFSILLVILLLWLLERVIVSPLKKLQQGLDQIAETQLEQQLEINNRDEIGKLATSFRQALKSIQQVIRGLQITEELQTLASQLNQTSQQQADGSIQQASAIMQVTAAMEELGRTAARITDTAQQVSEALKSTSNQIDLVTEVGESSQQASRQMVSVIDNTLTGMTKIKTQVDEVSQYMAGLNEQTQAITQVLEVLQTITTRLNLLALNAAIEAANAGEYGERFAVVAREIRQLTVQTQTASHETGNLILAIQQGSQSVLQQVEICQQEVKLVEQSNQPIPQTLRHLEASAEQLGHVVQQLQQLAQQAEVQMQDIRQATFQQQTSNQQVVNSARVVGVVAQQATALTSSVADGSHKLQDLTTKLNFVLSKVRL